MKKHVLRSFFALLLVMPYISNGQSEQIIENWQSIVKQEALPFKSEDKALSYFKSNINLYYYAGYLFVASPFFQTGNRSSAELIDLNMLEKGKSPHKGSYKERENNWKKWGIPIEMDTQQNEQWRKRVAHWIVGQYKIHLMPKDKEMTPIFEKLINLIKTDKTFTELVASIKFNPYYDQTYEQAKKGNSFVMPRVVIYPINGKENTQKLLNFLYEKLKKFKGLGITPRFNEKITDLIYVAQGDADSKKNSKFNKYFDSEKVYYSAEYFSQYGFEDMKLENPANIK